MNRTKLSSLFALPILLSAMAIPTLTHAADKQPNIVVIMGDDIGWSNIGVYNQGMMAGRTPNLDQLANEGMRFTDYYAEASCTASGNLRRYSTRNWAARLATAGVMGTTWYWFKAFS